MDRIFLSKKIVAKYYDRVWKIVSEIMDKILFFVNDRIESIAFLRFKTRTITCNTDTNFSYCFFMYDLPIIDIEEEGNLICGFENTIYDILFYSFSFASIYVRALHEYTVREKESVEDLVSSVD